MSCTCGATTPTECSCPAGLRGSTRRRGNGAPTVLSTDLAGDEYIQEDTTPYGEIWSFNGVLWTDSGEAEQGDTGAPGASGGFILYNNHTPVTTVSNPLADLMTYSMPANTLTADGDEVIIEAYLSSSGTNNGKALSLSFGAETFPTFLLFGAIETSAILTMRIVRVSDTSIRIQSKGVKIFNTFGFFEFGNPINKYDCTAVAIASLTSNAVTIVSQAGNSGGGETMTCKYMTVEYKHFT